MCHATKALGGEAQAIEVLARPLALVSATIFFFIART
jgi:hypothetical protein